MNETVSSAFSVRSPSAESLFEDFTGELLDGPLFFFGGLAQSQETLFVNLELKVAPPDVHVETDRLQKFLVVGNAVSIPKIRSLLVRSELVRQWVNVFVCNPHLLTFALHLPYHVDYHNT